MDYAAKFIQYVILAVLGSAAGGALIDGGFKDKTLWYGVIVVAIGAATVYFKANTVTQPHAKTAIAIFTAGALVLVSAWSDQRITTQEVVQIIMAVIGAVQIGRVENVGDNYHRSVGVR